MVRDDSPGRERWEGRYDDSEDNGVAVVKDSGKHRSKERSKSSRREDRDHKSRDRGGSREREKEIKDSEKERVSSRDRRKEDRDDREKDRAREKVREKDSDREKYRDRDRDRERDRIGKEKEREKERESEKDNERGRDKERGKDKSRDKDKEKERDTRVKDRERDKDREKERDTRVKDREREKERDKHKGREKDRELDRDRERDMPERERGKERGRDKERETDVDKERSRDKDKVNRRQREEGHDRGKDLGKDDKIRPESEDSHYKDMPKQGIGQRIGDDNIGTLKLKENTDSEQGVPHGAVSDLGDRISKMKEERLKKKSEGSSDILSWVSKSRKLEEKRNAEKERALQRSKFLEEQDNLNQGDNDDEATASDTSHVLAGVKVLHGLDKVIEGGAVVLTLKDQSILANGDINEDVDMLENVEIGEQKQRDEAYKAAKKKPGIYEDKFSEDPGSEKKMLPQYDDPIADEGVTLDARGRFSGEAEKKLEELRRRISGVSETAHFEDLSSSGKITSDYYTHEEMMQFKKPKKKKSLRKKDKLDLDALEAEAVSAGLGVGDLGSRRDGKMQALKEELAKSEAEKRSNAFQSAYARADEASRALRTEQSANVHSMEEDDNPVFNDDDEDLRKSLERARKLALEKQAKEVPSGPQAIAFLASSGKNSSTENENLLSGESQENKVVFTEMEEFVWGLQLDEEAHKPDGEDVFMEEDEAPKVSAEEKNDDDGGWTDIQDNGEEETPADENKEVTMVDKTIHEVAVGKGLSGALNLLKERGTLKESIEWGGRNMDKKKSKLVGIYENDGTKEIRIERTDEFGRILTPKEAFRLLSHKFHGKGPGKMKQEKRMRQYQEELKIKQMKNADTPSLSVERMREAQAQLKTPYLVLSGNVKPGQTSDPRSGFATVEKDFPGGLTPMLGDRKVEHFLGIKRKSEPGDMGPPKKPKT